MLLKGSPSRFGKGPISTNVNEKENWNKDSVSK